jgi:hypothetical protein
VIPSEAEATLDARVFGTSWSIWQKLNNCEVNRWNCLEEILWRLWPLPV